MRTTVTLDPDVAELLKRLMEERHISFKEAVNETLRLGLGGRGEAFETPARHLGRPKVDLDRALALAAALEDEALVAKLELRK